jgi:hypothetical protein
LKEEGTSQFLTQLITVLGHIAGVQSVNQISILSDANSSSCEGLILASCRFVSIDTANQTFTGSFTDALGKA